MLSYAVALLGVAILVMLYRRDRSLLQAQRAKFFDLCLDLFQAYRVTQDGPDYPLLSGRYRDHEVRLQPLVDSMAWRKVPVLWLKVTVLKPNSYRRFLISWCVLAGSRSTRRAMSSTTTFLFPRDGRSRRCSAPTILPPRRRSS